MQGLRLFIVGKAANGNMEPKFNNFEATIISDTHRQSPKRFFDTFMPHFELVGSSKFTRCELRTAHQNRV